MTTVNTVPLINLTFAFLHTNSRSDPNVYFAPKTSQDVAFSEPSEIMHKIWKDWDPTDDRIKELAKIGTHELTDGGELICMVSPLLLPPEPMMCLL